MRTLILTRGCPGAGKSTWISQHNLQNYTIEPDQLRIQLGSLQYNPDGSTSIPQTKDSKVWALVMQILEERMKDGQLTVIDATHSRTQLINRYRALAKQYRYRVFVIDFTSIPLETILTQNASRNRYKIVPSDRIKDIHARLQVDKPSSWVTQIHYQDEDQIDKILHPQPIDCSQYNAVNVIGDIHSSFTALNRAIPTIKPDELYIFLGDYLDRGTQPVETFTFIESIAKHSNVILLEGNHETHWRTLDTDKKQPKHVIKTLEQLAEANIEPKRLKKLYESLAQCSLFSFHGRQFVCTHGGISIPPVATIPITQLISGFGRYADTYEVDRLAHRDYTFIHGHRNIDKEPIHNTPNTYNLNGKPEYGEELRAIKILKDKILNISQIQPKEQAIEKPQKPVTNFTGESLLSDFTNNKSVKVKDLNNGLYSVNFTSKTFKSRSWNEMALKARGLFLDKDSNIIARSYNKFFNYKEMEETKAKAIKELSYPLKVWQKENGFLGILSTYQDEWLICSKSTNQGDFAEMFKELVTPYLTDELKAYISQMNITLVFEVNHLNDPHMVEYDKSHIILLDIIFNKLEFEKYIDEVREAFAKRFNFKTKKLVATLNTYEDWRTFRETEQSKSIYEPNVEGWVIEDSNHFQFKLKSEFYSFWKRMRSIKDRLYKKHNHAPEILASLHRESEYKFFNFLLTLDKEELLKSIIILRNKYLKVLT